MTHHREASTVADMAAISAAALRRAWIFVASDRALNPMSLPDRHVALMRHIVTAVSRGDRDVLRIANRAIVRLRRAAEAGHTVRPSGP
jgi:hypothetical protein